MKFSKTTSAAVILLSNALTISAFTPTPSYTQQRTRTSTTTTSHNIVSDPYLISSAVDADIIGQLALILPIGLGIAMGNSNSKGQYKTDNTENVDLAVLGGSAVAVLDKVEEEETATPEVTPAQEEFFDKKETKAAAAVVEKKEPEPEPSVPVVTAKPGKASIPSKELLASTEKAKAEVQKKGVQETKDKMSSKASPPAPPPAEEKKEIAEVASTEVAETKKPGGKRRIVKGVTLIVAAGAVAVARNVVKAYLGRGML